MTEGRISSLLKQTSFGNFFTTVNLGFKFLKPIFILDIIEKNYFDLRRVI